jgi:hypothetical protein
MHSKHPVGPKTRKRGGMFVQLHKDSTGVSVFMVFVAVITKNPKIVFGNILVEK